MTFIRTRTLVLKYRLSSLRASETYTFRSFIALTPVILMPFLFTALKRSLCTGSTRLMRLILIRIEATLYRGRNAFHFNEADLMYFRNDTFKYEQVLEKVRKTINDLNLKRRYKALKAQRESIKEVARERAKALIRAANGGNAEAFHKLEPAYTAIFNRNALRSEDLRNLLVILPKALKAALKLKAKPFKTAKSYERLGKVISFLGIDYEATRIKLLKGRDLLKNLTFSKTIAFFAALFTFKRSSFEATVSVAEASEDCLIISSKLIPKATDDPNSTLYRTRKEIFSDLAKVFGIYKTKDKKIRPINEADGVKAVLSGKQYLFPRIADIPRSFRITLERIANLDVGNILRLKEKDLFKKMMLSKEKSIAFA
ncbi:hypothetical protein MBM_04003 [Drepanopeziza brunnea f. sp. 'multigermtubi' MB_m1]|uniref:Uncharacterized protein n=1 Tax=Marssonina brunnea f. sp. multigermtubi (strain MB_m1) TaxID=1072389 RepID=K1XXY0_MARBU|nr:uncharacterized protein MBM_04003 [Drepanopeziza brunnea f. sp. 'multigermtubi' MB_m1]EKD17634.1 hypothetical protein MBM_04003 [Drepanopeziza brunnea f. sp. 'multigermtubi' MB_m1]